MSESAVRETAVTFACDGESLVGIVTLPQEPEPCTGVVVVVGGPQYRVGSHRQFVHLSRRLATNGIACMRFDVRGMGDSTGEPRTFMDVDDDIRAAVDAFVRAVPSVSRIVLWGLCDGASAACFYAPTDARVSGLVLANPWVRTKATQAETYLRHYYWRRLREPDFWKKLFSGRLRVRDSARSLGALLRAARTGAAPANARDDGTRDYRAVPFPLSMCAALAAFRKDVLVVLSGNDYTATEFRDVVGASPEWKRVLRRDWVTWCDVEDSDHTFSTQAWRTEVAELTLGWIGALPS